MYRTNVGCGVYRLSCFQLADGLGDHVVAARVPSAQRRTLQDVVDLGRSSLRESYVEQGRLDDVRTDVL